MNARVSINLDQTAPSLSTLNVAPDFTFKSHNIRCILKRYTTYPKGQEIPNGSLAMVNYMMGCYKKDEEWVLTPNLNWVMVLAVDD